MTLVIFDLGQEVACSRGRRGEGDRECKVRGTEAAAHIQSVPSLPGQCNSGQHLSSSPSFLSLPTLTLTSDAFVCIPVKLFGCPSQECL